MTVSLLLSHWYPGSGVVLDCIDSWSLHPYLLKLRNKKTIFLLLTLRTFDSFFHLVYPSIVPSSLKNIDWGVKNQRKQTSYRSMRGALLVCTLALCLLQTLDNNMVARAGKVTKIRKLEDVHDEFIWCCIEKGCPSSYFFERHGVFCRGHIINKKFSCKCVYQDH